MVTVNMSEFQEAHSVSNLKGAPPGYVGFGRGGVLTEAVRRRPYSVVLLDEMEKAHPDVLELFFQVFDKGTLEDGEGVQIDFKNTLILLTSNAGQDIIIDACEAQELPDAGDLVARLRPGARAPVLAGLPRPAGAGALLPAGRRADPCHRRPEARQAGAALRAQPPRRFHLGRQRHAGHRRPLHRSRQRRPQHRPHPDPVHPAGALAPGARAHLHVRPFGSVHMAVQTDGQFGFSFGPPGACHERRLHPGQRFPYGEHAVRRGR
jgi:type VI secretion system protein VasG